MSGNIRQLRNGQWLVRVEAGRGSTHAGAFLHNDPVMRYVASRKKSVITKGTPPGAKYNGIAFVIVMLLFVASL